MKIIKLLVFLFISINKNTSNYIINSYKNKNTKKYTTTLEFAPE